MRRILVLAPLLVAAGDAEANQCTTLIPHVVTPELPLGCPLVAYVSEQVIGFNPTVERDRMGTREPIEPASITSETELVEVWIESIDEACVEWNGYVQQPFDRLSVELAEVEIGDVIYFSYAYQTATIVEAGPCPAVAPPQYLFCQDPIQEYWACDEDGPYHPDDPDDPATPEDPDGGCAAGGGGLGLAAIALVLGLRRRRVTRG